MKRILEVQYQIGVLGKDSKNPFFKSAYLDLNKLLIHVTPLLHKNGLLLLQPIHEGKVWTQIIDAETGTILADSSIELPIINDPQKLGSAITYFRRYTLKSLLAIAEGDDDANLASKPSKPVKPIKKVLSDDRFIKALEAVKSGNTSIDLLISTFKLTKEQTQELSKL
jgi:hypothetical protein